MKNGGRIPMKHIMLNLKRFDVPVSLGGVNRLAPVERWGAAVAEGTRGIAEAYPQAEFAAFLPEAHLLGAAAALAGSRMLLGCQGVYREDVAPGGNFGAFTTLRPAAAARALGCAYTIIGHCEERMEKAGVLAEAGVSDPAAVDRLLGREVKAAQAAGLRVLFCIGEKAEDRPRCREVLRAQLGTGLAGADRSRIVVGYEPVWAIGPGKTPPGREEIRETARFLKDETDGMDVVYGGGLKSDNAAMLASIPEIDGGLIALTRFSGEIGFYPEEYAQIVKLYLGNEESEANAK